MLIPKNQIIGTINFITFPSEAQVLLRNHSEINRDKILLGRTKRGKELHKTLDVQSEGIRDLSTPQGQDLWESIC